MASKVRAGGERDVNSYQRRQIRCELMRHYGIGETVTHYYERRGRYVKGQPRPIETMGIAGGEHCACWDCGQDLQIDDETADNYLTMDRIVKGQDGGKYRTANILPACYECNLGREHEDEDKMTEEVVREYRAQYGDATARGWS